MRAGKISQMILTLIEVQKSTPLSKHPFEEDIKFMRRVRFAGMMFPHGVGKSLGLRHAVDTILTLDETQPLPKILVVMPGPKQSLGVLRANFEGLSKKHHPRLYLEAITDIPNGIGRFDYIFIEDSNRCTNEEIKNLLINCATEKTLVICLSAPIIE